MMNRRKKTESYYIYENFLFNILIYKYSIKLTFSKDYISSKEKKKHQY